MKRWLTSKNEGLKGLFIATGGVGVLTSPTSWASITGLAGDSRTCVFIPSSVTTWATALCFDLPFCFKLPPQGFYLIGLYQPPLSIVSTSLLISRDIIVSLDPSVSRLPHKPLTIQLEDCSCGSWAPCALWFLPPRSLEGDEQTPSTMGGNIMFLTRKKKQSYGS